MLLNVNGNSASGSFSHISDALYIHRCLIVVCEWSSHEDDSLIHKKPGGPVLCTEDIIKLLYVHVVKKLKKLQLGGPLMKDTPPIL